MTSEMQAMAYIQRNGQNDNREVMTNYGEVMTNYGEVPYALEVHNPRMSVLNFTPL